MSRISQRMAVRSALVTLLVDSPTSLDPTAPTIRATQFQIAPKNGPIKANPVRLSYSDFCCLGGSDDFRLNNGAAAKTANTATTARTMVPTTVSLLSHVCI